MGTRGDVFQIVETRHPRKDEPTENCIRQVEQYARRFATPRSWPWKQTLAARSRTLGRAARLDANGTVRWERELWPLTVIPGAPDTWRELETIDAVSRDDDESILFYLFADEPLVVAGTKTTPHAQSIVRLDSETGAVRDVTPISPAQPCLDVARLVRRGTDLLLVGATNRGCGMQLEPSCPQHEESDSRVLRLHLRAAY